MTITTALILFGVNFLILYALALVLSHFSMKRKKELEELLELKIQQEEDRLEDLSNDLLKIADVLLNRIEEKEKEVNKTVKKIEALVAEANEIYVEPASTQPPKSSKAKNRTVGRVRVERRELLKQSKEYLDMDSKFKEIYFLADKGEAIAKIAKKTGKTKGEVELVLSLRDVKKRD